MVVPVNADDVKTRMPLSGHPHALDAAGALNIAQFEGVARLNGNRRGDFPADAEIPGAVSACAFGGAGASAFSAIEILAR